MYDQEEQWVQSASGFWVPKQQENPKKQRLLEQKVQLDPEPQRDWRGYWETCGQAWRWEPEIDQERQQFLLNRLDAFEKARFISPFQEISLTRADLEWLVGDEQRQPLNLREAFLNRVDLCFLPLEGANFRFAKLEGASFMYAELKGANFGSAKLEGASFVYAELEGAYFESAKLEGANFWYAELEGVDLRRAHVEKSSFEEATLGDVQGVGPAIADVLGWEAVYLAAIEWSQLWVLGDEVEVVNKAKSSQVLRSRVINQREE